MVIILGSDLVAPCLRLLCWKPPLASYRLRYLSRAVGAILVDFLLERTQAASFEPAEGSRYFPTPDPACETKGCRPVPGLSDALNQLACTSF